MTRDEAMKVVMECLEYLSAIDHSNAKYPWMRERSEKVQAAIAALPFLHDAAGAVGGVVDKEHERDALNWWRNYPDRENWSSGYASVIDAILQRALKPVENGGGVGVPVGWQVYNALINKWTRMYDTKFAADDAVKEGFTIRPLYASPPPPATIDPAIIAAIDETLEWYDDLGDDNFVSADGGGLTVGQLRTLRKMMTATIDKDKSNG